MRQLTLGALTTVMLLAGCATQNQYTQVAPPAVAGQPSLPAIEVFNDRPSVVMRQQCKAFDQQSVLHHCQLNRINAQDVQRALFKSEQFAPNEDTRFTPDYTLQLATAKYLQEDMEGFGNALVSGLSLMLIPLHQTFTLKAEATLRWRGQLLDTFEVEAPFTQSVNLANQQLDLHAQMAEAIGAALLTELQTRALFTPEFLAQQIKASDYQRDLVVPEQVGNYQLEQRLWLQHPLQGSYLTFVDKDFQFDQFNLSVYPIRRADWHDTYAALDMEAVNLQTDMTQTAKEYNAALNFQPRAQLTWPTDNGSLLVMQLAAKHHSDEGEPLNTRIFLFVKEDKVVVASSTLAGENPPLEAFEMAAQQLARELVVPVESPFMAALRQEWRDKSIDQGN